MPGPTHQWRGRHGRPQVPEVRHARPARRPAARSGDRGARRADLSDHVLRLRRHRPCRGPVQPGARRAHLQPHLEPDRGGARGARRGARAWGRRGRRGLGPGRAPPGGRDPDGAGRAHRGLGLALRRQRQPARPDPAALRHRDDFRKAARLGRHAGRGPARDAAFLRRNPGQPGPGGARHPGRRRDRARRRGAAADRQHLRHSVPVQPDHARRRPGGAFRDQVAGRPRAGHRRRAGRRRPLRLGGERQVPDPDRALRRLSRHRLRRGIRAPGVLHARAPRACATSAAA